MKAYDHALLDKYAAKIVETVKKTGADVSGPIPLPTEKEVVTIIRAVHKYKDSREQFEQRTHKRLIDVTNATNLEFHSLGAGKIDRNIDPFIIDITYEKDHKLSSHEGEEFIYVLEGEIEVEYGKDKFTVAAGDSIFYDSVVPHHLHSTGDKAKILAVLYTPY